MVLIHQKKIMEGYLMADFKKIYLMNGFVDIIPYNNKGNLIYKIKHPIEINNGNWACEIIFFKSKEIFYHNSSTIALNISLIEDKLEFVYFSKDYEMVFFYEKKDNDYILKIINYKYEEVFELNRLKSKINLKSFISEFTKNDYQKNIFLINKFDFVKTDFVKNQFKQNIFNRWFPEN